MRKKNHVQSVSFPDEELLAAVRARAKAEGRSLSNYIARLIERDLGWETKVTAVPPAIASRGAEPGTTSKPNPQNPKDAQAILDANMQRTLNSPPVATSPGAVYIAPAKNIRRKRGNISRE